MGVALKPDSRIEVLIAEDSPTQAARLKHILEQEDYQVTSAANGRLALEAARRRKPALIISDVVMPEMTGYELCNAIKSDPRLSDIPVILVTTLSDPQDVIRGLACRADNFILKPYDTDYLLGRVQFVLVNSRMRQSEQPGMGLEIFFNGQRHFITADRLQILNLLLSTYEAAIQRNRELTSTQDTLRQTNEELQQLTQELEDRVRMRTVELERSNEALRQAQQAVIQQERLRALGLMASGIEKAITNAISPIALYTDSLIERESNLSTRARDQLLTIQRAIDDVAATVARMREFYRPHAEEVLLHEIQVNPLVDQVADLTRARWSDMPQRKGVMIELRTDLADGLPAILGAENEIRDALTNLIFNAVDAMPEGGTIEVCSYLRSVPASDGTSSGVVALEVKDSGVGMDEETRRRCLEPFFTTKGERGTGLGLAMVYGMAQRHGAALEIESQPGAGTTMRVLFQVSSPLSSSEGQSGARQTSTHGLRLLIVDDDPLLIESLRNTLEADGHDVTAADGGQPGIDAFRKALAQGRPFDLVVTDFGMPYVDGRQVIEAIRAASPKTPIVLLTGWGQRVEDDGRGLPGADRLLSKPPRLQELRAALSELTAARAPG